VTQCRVPIFWPTNKPPRSKNLPDLVIENDWGKGTIKNCKLTQVHRNLLDVIFAYHQVLYRHEDGCVGFLVDLYEVQKQLQIEVHNHNWIFKKLKDLMKTIFVTETKDWIITGVILRKHSYSKRDAGHTPDKFGINKLYYIVFEAEFMKFFDLDMHVSYFQLVDKIISLKNPTCQALVRFCLSHCHLNMDLEELLKKIGILRPEMHRREKSRIIQQIFLKSDVLIEEFGIRIDPMKNKRLGVFYKQHKDVCFKKKPDLPEINQNNHDS
jgi:hypothetical protein